MSGAPALYLTPAPASSSGLVLLDWTSATESNTGGKGANTSLGETVRFEAAAVQQLLTTLNGYAIAVEIPDKPADATGIRLLMEIATPDAAPAIGANAGIHLAITTQAALAANTGVVAGVEYQNTGTRYRTHAECKKLGTAPAGTTIIDTAAAAGKLYVELIGRLSRDNGELIHVSAGVWGEDGTTNGENYHHLDVTGVTGTTFYAMILAEQNDAAPGDTLDSQNIRVWGEWLQKAA